ncbi:MAG: GtrA family protein [Oscillospiraceae bacterium]|jgi:putative flippase GtrA|nr:GtrA family protein [Oscillospiraceae bacterium]
MKTFWQKHKTILLYLAAGGFTTLVNYLLLFVFLRLFGSEINLWQMLTEESENEFIFNLANTFAVAGAVVFAYVVNKVIVFRSKTKSARAFWRELIAFLASRGLTTLFEIAACAFLVSVLNLPELPSKFGVTVVVILLNYVLSVKIVFKKKDGTPEQGV